MVVSKPLTQYKGKLLRTERLKAPLETDGKRVGPLYQDLSGRERNKALYLYHCRGKLSRL